LPPPPGAHPPQATAAPQPKPLPPPPPGAKPGGPPLPKPKKKERKKERRKLKFFNTGKKKAGFAVIMVGLLIMVLGIVYPIVYWPSIDAYSGADLSEDTAKGPGFVLYNKFDRDHDMKIHDTISSIKIMRGSIFLDGVTYTEIVQPDGSTRAIGDTYLIGVSSNQYFVIPGSQDPELNVGDSILAECTIKEIKGRGSQNMSTLREIPYSTKADVAPDSTDGVFFGVTIVGIVILIIGFLMWIAFVLQPEEKPPAYVDIHETKKREFLDGVVAQQQQHGQAYPCPICGLNLTYREELGKWYCEICNKLM
jgi:hypothetical protein